MVALRFLLLPLLALNAERVNQERAWWTGKDSNLRSPQGAADLQSAGFSHSPTRPSLGLPGFASTNPETRRDENSCPKIIWHQTLMQGISGNTKWTRV